MGLEGYIIELDGCSKDEDREMCKERDSSEQWDDQHLCYLNVRWVEDQLDNPIPLWRDFILVTSHPLAAKKS